MKANCAYWAQGVYDTPNVETYVFRIYGRIISYQFGMSGLGREKILEFGCGAGGAAKFFDEKGFTVFGVDQSEIDIARCKERLPHIADNFLTVSPHCSPDDDWFDGTEFSIVTSFQTLYYLNDHDLQNRLLSLYKVLKPGGIFIATMMHESSWYYDMSEPAECGMRLVKFFREQDVGRQDLYVNDHYINFTKDEADLKRKFHMFDPVHTSGYYDGVYRDDQGSEKHLVFIGQKPL